MAGFENYSQEIREIERKRIAPSINWDDDAQVRSLAWEALDHATGDVTISPSDPIDARLMGKMDLFGLAGIMLRTMEESATVGVESHGGPAWKSFAREPCGQRNKPETRNLAHYRTWNFTQTTG